MQLEGLATDLPVYSELSSSGAYRLPVGVWCCVVCPVRGSSAPSYVLREWHLHSTACGRGWLYDPTQVALPPPVGRSSDLTDSSRRRFPWPSMSYHRAKAGESFSSRGTGLDSSTKSSTCTVHCSACSTGTTVH